MDMLAVTAPRYCDPSGYQLLTVPRPSIIEPSDVIIKIHAASINPIDVKKASGALRLALKDEFPYKIGFDCAGVIAEAGDTVSRLKVGDEVYVRLPEAYRGAWSEYVRCAEQVVALKPSSLSFEDAASLPLAAMTALQALRKYRGDLAGKTVFVPAGLSGTGAYACQLAKNVFHAGKVITTVSTAKVPRVPELLGSHVVDEVIDYTKQDPNNVIPAGTVDFALDTTGQAMRFLSLMVPNTSLIVSISTLPSGSQMQRADFMQRPDRPQMPWFARSILDAGDAIRKLRARRWKVEYTYMFLEKDVEDLDLIREFAEDGRLLPVVGTRVNLRNFEKVKEACQQVYVAKGGVGKAVISIV